MERKRGRRSRRRRKRRSEEAPFVGRCRSRRRSLRASALPPLPGAAASAASDLVVCESERRHLDRRGDPLLLSPFAVVVAAAAAAATAAVAVPFASVAAAEERRERLRRTHLGRERQLRRRAQVRGDLRRQGARSERRARRRTRGRRGVGGRAAADDDGPRGRPRLKERPHPSSSPRAPAAASGRAPFPCETGGRKPLARRLEPRADPAGHEGAVGGGAVGLGRRDREGGQRRRAREQQQRQRRRRRRRCRSWKRGRGPLLLLMVLSRALVAVVVLASRCWTPVDGKESRPGRGGVQGQLGAAAEGGGGGGRRAGVAACRAPSSAFSAPDPAEPAAEGGTGPRRTVPRDRGADFGRYRGQGRKQEAEKVVVAVAGANRRRRRRRRIRRRRRRRRCCLPFLPPPRSHSQRRRGVYPARDALGDVRDHRPGAGPAPGDVGVAERGGRGEGGRGKSRGRGCCRERKQRGRWG